MYFLLLVSVCVTDSSVTFIRWGRWELVQNFCSKGDTSWPLSRKTFSERTRTTYSTGMLRSVPQSTLVSTTVNICWSSLFIMLIFTTRRDSFFRALLQNTLLFNILSSPQNLCYCDEQKNAYPTDSNSNIIHYSSLYY